MPWFGLPLVIVRVSGWRPEPEDGGLDGIREEEDCIEPERSLCSRSTGDLRPDDRDDGGLGG